MKCFFTKTNLISASVALSAVLSLPVYSLDGEKIAFDRKKGNCVSCHAMPTADPKKATLPGNMAPPLVAMKSRYPKKSDLRAQIHDSTIINPYSIMPPFGRHEVLSSGEVDAVTDYIYTL